MVSSSAIIRPLRFASQTPSVSGQPAAEAKPIRPDLAPYLTTPEKDWLAQFEPGQDRAMASELLKGIEFTDVKKLRRICQSLHEWLLKQPGFDLDKARFMTLGTAKSGGLFHYFYRQANGLDTRLGIDRKDLYNPKPLSPDKSVDTLVILDDFIGSGGQLEEYLTKAFNGKQQELLKKQYKKIFVLCGSGTAKGMAYLNKTFGQNSTSGLPPVVVHVDQVNRPIFSPRHQHFSATVQQKLVSLLGKYKKCLPAVNERPNGHLLYANFYNIPTSTLPLIWSSENGWKPLLKRFVPNEPTA